MKKLFASVITLLAFTPKFVLAHCPLCTAGAGVLAVGAASLGVSSVVVGILIGAFGLALSLWLAGLVKKRYFRYQKSTLTLAIFLITVVPIMPLVQDYAPFYVALLGEYGTLLHNTYTINLYLLGSTLGALVVASTPHISRFITNVRGKQIPYQGLSITFLLLILGSLIAQLLS